MRQKTINLRNQGSFDKKFDFFSPDPKSHTQKGSLSAKNASKKFSLLGTFKVIFDLKLQTRPASMDLVGRLKLFSLERK